MDAAQRLLIQEKLADMEGHVQELRATLPATVKEYLEQPTIRRAIERLAQIVAESATDINCMIAEGNALMPPATARLR
jgi:uncharacterized protein YutE (UPF0331/DUF86 family)